MSPAVTVWVVVGAISVALLVVALVALLRSIRRLSETLQQFRSEVEPLLGELAEESDRARQHAEELPDRVPRPGPGGKIRG